MPIGLGFPSKSTIKEGASAALIHGELDLI